MQTSLAGGDVTLALLLTVTTNTLGVLYVPLLAKLLVSVNNVQIDAISLLVKLISTLLVPLLVSLMIFCCQLKWPMGESNRNKFPIDSLTLYYS